MWIDWHLAEQHLDDFNEAQVVALAQAFDAQVHSASSAAAAARLSSWKLWASTTAMENGARLAHRFSRAAAPPPALFRDSKGEILGRRARPMRPRDPGMTFGLKIAIALPWTSPRRSARGP